MNKNYIYILIFILGVGNYETISAQVDQRDQWMNKYWFYRYRLINDYMIVGEGQGMSLPADIRRGVATSSPLNTSQGGGANNWGERVKDNQGKPFRNGRIDWGQDGPIHLGWYIAVLASELGCLKKYTLANDPSGNCLNQTKMELMYALKALDRLDAKGENLQNQAQGGLPDIGDHTNGFFIRDDIPDKWILAPDDPDASSNPDAVARYKKLNSLKTLSNNDNSKYTYVSQIGSSYKVAVANHDPGVVDPSKDQYLSPFMGLAMVIKFCDNNDNYNNYYFKSNARRIMNNIIGFFNWQPEGYKYSLTWRPLINNYFGTGYPVHSNDPDRSDTNDGLCFGFYCVAKKWSDIQPPLPPSNAIFNWAISGNTADAMNRTLFPLNSQLALNTYMPGILGACGNAFYYDDLRPNYYSNYNPDNENSFNTLVLKNLGENFDSQILPLMHAVMFATDPDMGISEFSNLLDAPCYGPHNFGPQNYILGNSNPNIDQVPDSWVVNTKSPGPGANFTTYSYTNGYDQYQWSSTNCWVSRDRRGDLTSDRWGWPKADGTTGFFKVPQNGGEYNGLDYMLFYNLFMYQYGTSYHGNTAQVPQTDYKNELTNVLNKTYPYYVSGNAIGGIASQIKNIGFQSISSNEHITNSGNVWDQAGEVINLTPGFKVEVGGLFKATCSRLTDCIGDGNTYNAPEPKVKKQSILSTIRQNGLDDLIFEPYKIRIDTFSAFQILKAYPNPFTNEINIDISTNGIGNFQISIINTLGVSIYQQTVSNATDNSISHFNIIPGSISKGVYTLIISNNNTKTQKKIVKY